MGISCLDYIIEWKEYIECVSSSIEHNLSSSSAVLKGSGLLIASYANLISYPHHNESKPGVCLSVFDRINTCGRAMYIKASARFYLH